LAPQTNEFGTKVGLLAGLVVVCAARPILDRLLPEPRSPADEIRRFATRLAVGGDAGTGAVRGALRIGIIAVAVVAVGFGIVAAGSPARGFVVADTTEALDAVPHQVDPATFPAITISQDVSDWNHEIDATGAQHLLVTLGENLELENQALLRRDASLLTAVDHGDRLADLRGRLQRATATGTTVLAHYQFDSVNLTLIVPFGVQTGLSLGFESRGTMTEETYDAGGAVVSRQTSPFAHTFAMRQATGGRWLNVAVLPRGVGS
jgi:hypothetical protein